MQDIIVTTGGQEEKRVPSALLYGADEESARHRSRSSFELTDEFGIDMDELQSSFMQIDDWRDISRKMYQSRGKSGTGLEVATVLTSEQSVEYECDNVLTVATRTFYIPNGQTMPYAVAIRAFRVANGHAQYQVVLSCQTKVWKSWKRFSDFKLLAEHAKISDLKESMRAWNDIVHTQRWFRCLEDDYLRKKCYSMEKFLGQLLFEIPTPTLLLTFVQTPFDLYDDFDQPFV